MPSTNQSNTNKLPLTQKAKEAKQTQNQDSKRLG